MKLIRRSGEIKQKGKGTSADYDERSERIRFDWMLSLCSVIPGDWREFDLYVI